MQGKTHAAWGAACGLAVAAITRGNPWACATAGLMAGLLPDWIQINIPGASKQVKGLFGHRGISHWLWVPMAIWWFAGWSVDMPVVLSICVAWASHIALDVFSNGAPVLWPFGRLTLGHIKTGSKLDTLVGGAGLVMAGVAMVYLIT